MISIANAQISPSITKMLGLRVPFHQFPVSLSEEHSDHWIDWNPELMSQKRMTWDEALRSLCQQAARDNSEPYQIWDDWISDEHPCDVAELLAMMDEKMPIALSREPGHPDGSHEPKLIALELFTRRLEPHNSLLGDLIYYGDQVTLGYLFYQLGCQSHEEIFDCLLFDPPSAFTILELDQFTDHAIRGILDAERFDLAEDLLQKVIQKVIEGAADCYDEGSIYLPEIVADLLWATIQTGKMDLIEIAASYYRHASYQCDFTAEQLTHIVSLDNRKLWEIVAAHKYEQIPSHAPIDWLVFHYESLKRGDIMDIPELVDQFCDDPDRAIAIMQKVDHLLDKRDLLEIILRCYKEQMLSAMKAVARYEGLDQDMLAYYLLNKKLIAAVFRVLDLDLSDHNCFLLQFSPSWRPSVRNECVRSTRSNSISYHDTFAISRYQLSFIGPLDPEPEGPRSTVHDLSGSYDIPRRSEMVVALSDPPEKDRRNLNNPDGVRRCYVLGDIVEIPVNGWYLYHFTTSRKQRARCFYSIPTEDDPEDYLMERMRSALERMPPLAKQKSARSAVTER